MSLAEFLYFCAFSTYIVGAAWSLRTDGKAAAVLLFSMGAFADFAVTGLAMFGPEVFDMGATGRNVAIDLGAALGVVVWLLVLSTLLVWWRGPRKIFHILTVATLLVWLVDYLAFLYGLHVYPMT